MKELHIACMKWPGAIEPVCAGSNKRAITRAAVGMLRDEHGDGPVVRLGAMCSVPITSSDIEIITVPYITTKETP